MILFLGLFGYLGCLGYLGCFGLKLFDSFYITHMTLFHSDPVSSAEEAEGMIVIERTYAIAEE